MKCLITFKSQTESFSKHRNVLNQVKSCFCSKCAFCPKWPTDFYQAFWTNSGPQLSRPRALKRGENKEGRHMDTTFFLLPERVRTSPPAPPTLAWAVSGACCVGGRCAGQCSLRFPCLLLFYIYKTPASGHNFFSFLLTLDENPSQFIESISHTP